MRGYRAPAGVSPGDGVTQNRQRRRRRRWSASGGGSWIQPDSHLRRPWGSSTDDSAAVPYGHQRRAGADSTWLAARGVLPWPNSVLSLLRHSYRVLGRLLSAQRGLTSPNWTRSQGSVLGLGLRLGQRFRVGLGLDQVWDLGLKVKR